MTTRIVETGRDRIDARAVPLPEDRRLGQGLTVCGQPGNWRAPGLVTSAKRGQHSKVTSPEFFWKRIRP